MWESTNKRIGFTYWHRKEPNAYDEEEDCLLMGYYPEVGWNDIGCHALTGAVCEAQP